MDRLPALEAGEPHGALVLVPGVQQQHVAVRGPLRRHPRRSPRHAAEASRSSGRAAPRARALRLHPPVHVVGVQQGQPQLRRRRRAQAQPETQPHHPAGAARLSAAPRTGWLRPGAGLGSGAALGRGEGEPPETPRRLRAAPGSLRRDRPAARHGLPARRRCAASAGRVRAALGAAARAARCAPPRLAALSLSARPRGSPSAGQCPAHVPVPAVPPMSLTRR